MNDTMMREFTAADRCDRCGARAFHEAKRAGFAELLFCNHHFEKHRDNLLENYWLIESDVLAIGLAPVTTK